MKTSCLRLKLVELNFFASINADDQRKTYVFNVSKYQNVMGLFIKFLKFAFTDSFGSHLTITKIGLQFLATDLSKSTAFHIKSNAFHEILIFRLVPDMSCS